MAKKSNTKNSKSSFTVRELRAWIEGIQEIQGGDWVPNAEQWKKIKSKINQLPVEDVAFTQRETIMSNQSRQQQNRRVPHQSMVEEPVEILQSHVFQQMPQGQPIGGPEVEGPVGRIKVPTHIDTSKEPYKSSFA